MEHTIKLSDAHLGIVGAALAELPFKVAAPVINVIQAQINVVQAKSAEQDESKGAGAIEGA